MRRPAWGGIEAESIRAMTARDGGIARVTFRYGDADIEVRYLDRLPRRAEPMMRGGKTWVVTGVTEDGGGPVVTLARPLDALRAGVLRARREPKVSDELLTKSSALRERAAELGRRVVRHRTER